MSPTLRLRPTEVILKLPRHGLQKVAGHSNVSHVDSWITCVYAWFICVAA